MERFKTNISNVSNRTFIPPPIDNKIDVKYPDIIKV